MFHFLHLRHNQTTHFASPLRSQRSTLPPACRPLPEGRAGSARELQRRDMCFLLCNQRGTSHYISYFSSLQTNHFSLQRFSSGPIDTLLSSAYLKR